MPGESAFDMDGSESPDVGDEWKNWRVDENELESDEAADEGVTKKRKKSWKRRDDGHEMSTYLVDG